MQYSFDCVQLISIRYYYTVSKKRHWCCRLYLQRTSTDFGSFW